MTNLVVDVGTDLRRRVLVWRKTTRVRLFCGFTEKVVSRSASATVALRLFHSFTEKVVSRSASAPVALRLFHSFKEKVVSRSASATVPLRLFHSFTEKVVLASSFTVSGVFFTVFGGGSGRARNSAKRCARNVSPKKEQANLTCFLRTQLITSNRRSAWRRVWADKHGRFGHGNRFRNLKEKEWESHLSKRIRNCLSEGHIGLLERVPYWVRSNQCIQRNSSPKLPQWC